MITIKEAPLEKSKKASVQNNYNKQNDERLYCENCLNLIFYNGIIELYICVNKCRLKHDHGFINAEERQERLNNEIAELLPTLKAVLNE